MTTTVDVAEAQHQLKKLLEIAKSGDDVIISEGDIPIARLTGVKQPQQNGSGVDLFGIWKDRVPADADIESLLHEIRNDSSQALNG